MQSTMRKKKASQVGLTLLMCNVFNLKLYEDAVQTATVCSNRLKEHRFLMGDEASTVDAALYACLRILFQSPLRDQSLQQKFLKLPNLLEFVDHFHALYFQA